jgi:hypothetical protein
MVVEAVAKAPQLSRRVMVYVPAESPVSVALVPPPVHEYVYGDVPPEGLEDTLPLLLPLQLASLATLAVTLNVGGWVMVAEAVAVHPLLSFTVMV